MKNIKKTIILLISTLVLSIMIISIDLINVKEDSIVIDNNIYNSFNLLNEEKNDIAGYQDNKDKEVCTNSINDTTTVKKSNSVEEKPKNDQQTIEQGNKESIVETNGDENNPSESNIIESFNGNISGYGHDCYGCTSGRTASGIDISDGHIFYDDNEYGRIRMVAGDRKYPFGTIVKIRNFMGIESFYAIVEDRGGAIGLDKQIQFDLLFSQNSDAISLGIQKNVTFEIVRLGY